MELHIKEFEYQNIIKQQMYKQLIVLILCMFLLAFAIESIGYNFQLLYYILFISATFLLIYALRLKRKKKKVLGFDLVYIDENNRFFYNNLFIEMKDLQNYVISKETITLNFIDYLILIEKDANLYDYLNRFSKNKKPINQKKVRLATIVLRILFILFSCSLGNLFLGRIYSYLNHVEMISFSTILIPIIQMTSIILGFMFSIFIAKKFKKAIGLYISLGLIVLYMALPIIMSNDIHTLDNNRAYTCQNQKLTLYSHYAKGYGKVEKQINHVSSKAKVGNYQDVVYIVDHQKIKVISFENEDKKELISKINHQTYMGTYISTEYRLSFENDEVYFKKNYSSETIKLKRINNHMLYFKYNNDYYFIYILEKQNAIRLYDLSHERDLILRLASNPLEQFKSQTNNEDTNESEQTQNQTEESKQEESATSHDVTNENQTTNEDDPERVYFEKVYDLLIAQNKLENPCFDYGYSAKGSPYAVVSANDEYTLSLVFNKYKNNDEDYEIVLEKYIKQTSTQSLVDFYLVNTKTLEVTDQQRDYW